MRFFVKVMLLLVSITIVGYIQPVFSYVSDDLDFITVEGGAHGGGYSGKTYTVPSIGYKMVYIKPGAFMMGSPSSEPNRDRDESQHKVTLTRGFYLGATEVTQGQWKAVMGSNPSRFKNCGDDCPVERVSWNDAQEFIRKLNRKEGISKYRLPTEAEWEYACRAGTTTRYCCGDSESQVGAYAWYGSNSSSTTHPVAGKTPNAWGLYDMHGNVWEWCQDFYGNYPTGSVTDPPGQSSGSVRVLRGGSWYYSARGLRAADRSRFIPVSRLSYFGFRVARDL